MWSYGPAALGPLIEARSGEPSPKPMAEAGAGGCGGAEPPAK